MQGHSDNDIDEQRTCRPQGESGVPKCQLSNPVSAAQVQIWCCKAEFWACIFIKLELVGCEAGRQFPEVNMFC